MKRHRRQENTETTLPPPTLQEALNENVDATIFDKFNDLVIQYGSDLILRVYSVKSDNRSLGFIDEILTPEIDAFLQNPEIFLRDHYGTGVFRITVVSNATKKFITNLTISISAPKSTNSNPQDLLGELSRSFKEGLNLAKSSQANSNQNPFDITKLLELLMIQQEKSREREEKTLERIRQEENKLRQQELALLEKTLSNNSEVSKQFQPMIDFMSQSGKVLSSAMSMIERSANFLHNVTPETQDRPFVERLIIELGEKLLTSNPQLLERLLPMLQMRTPQLMTPLIKANANLPFENKTPKVEEPPKTEPITPNNPNSPNTPPAQPNVEQLFFGILISRIEKWATLEDAEACASDIFSDLEYFEARGVMSKEQTETLESHIISQNFIPHLESIIPTISAHKAFLNKLQREYEKLLNEPDDLPEDIKQ